MASEPFRVYFACVGNSARSQMAEAYARLLGGDRVEARSGGTVPKGHVLPEVLEALAEAGIDWSHAESEGIDAGFVQDADLVVTMGCGERVASSKDRPERSEDGPKEVDCPAFLGKRVVDWPLEDPEGMDLEGVREVRDEIKGRVRRLLEEELGQDL